MDATGEWTLSPLFDFTRSEGPNGWHTLSVAGEGEHPTSKDLLRLADDVDLAAQDAHEIIDAVQTAVAGLPGLARSLNLPPAIIKRLHPSVS